jgi:nitrite reductase/ring-hydroxylating ferredoxin subunit
MSPFEGWVRLAGLSALAEDTAFPARLGDVPVALYRLGGEVYAIDDVCTHAFALLSQGFVERGTIECPLHQACFDIVSGRCLSGPATVDLRTYAVKIEGDDVYVRASPDGHAVGGDGQKVSGAKGAGGE